jgi:hypothetical protein
MAAASAYRNAAWRLGLEADTRGMSVQGYLDGRRLFVGQVLEPGSQRPTRTVRAVLDLSVPLGLGLRLRSHKRRWGRVRPEGETTGDPDLDAHLGWRAIDLSRGQAVLTDEVRQALLDLVEQTSAIDISDDWVRVVLRRTPSRDTGILQLVETMRRVAVALESARLTLPCPPEVEERRHDWAELAERTGLQLEPELPALSGTYEGYEVQIYVSRRPGGFRAYVRLQFPEHRPIGLRVERQDGPDGFWSVGQDIQFGDPPFDDRFVIKGYDPAVVRAAFPPETRETMLGLDELGTVVVQDLYVEVLELPLETPHLQQTLERCVTLARQVRWP